MENNKKNIYIILSFFIIASLVLVIFFIFPLLENIKQNSEDLISAKNNLVNLNAQIDATKNFNKNYQAYKPDLEKIDKMFVDPKNPVDFIEFLENTASVSNITSQISLPQPSLNPQQFVVFQFDSKGNFLNMLNFLKKIEEGPYLIEIENLAIQNSDKNSKNVEATFAIKAFIQK